MSDERENISDNPRSWAAWKAEADRIRLAAQAFLDHLDKYGVAPGWGVHKETLRRALRRALAEHAEEPVKDPYEQGYADGESSAWADAEMKHERGEWKCSGCDKPAATGEGA